MLGFLKKKAPYVPGYFPVTTDMHSHILPGIDDGAPDIETSLQLVKGLLALGINRSIATPHIISDMYRNTPETISAALGILQEALQKEQLDFSVSAAAEYMLDAYFFELLSAGNNLLCIKDKLILTEFSFGYRPDNIKQMSFDIITGGYTPILAHPERYTYFHNDFGNYHLLAELGFLLQPNLLSFTGYYGRPAARAARYIVQNGLARFLGTDLHHERHLAALQDVKNHKIFSEVLSGERWNEML